MQHNKRAFVEKLDFLTSLGHGRTGCERKNLGIQTQGVVFAVTDLCILEPEPETNEFIVVSLHPGVSTQAVREHTRWKVRFAKTVNEMPSPTDVELRILRDLHARTARAHGPS